MPNGKDEQLDIGVANIGTANIGHAIIGEGGPQPEGDGGLQDDVHLKLYTYFQNRADAVKEAMFKTLTWTIGFAAALLALIFASLAKYDAAEATVPLILLVFVLAGAGVVICRYATRMLEESGEHIQSNWDLATKFKRHNAQLANMIAEGRSGSSGETPRVVRQLQRIVNLFNAAFVSVLLASVLVVLLCTAYCFVSSCASGVHERLCPLVWWEAPKAQYSEERGPKPSECS
jgi:hypothetical protein